MEDSSNEHRMKRQRQYIKALYEKTVEKSESDDNFAINAAAKMGDYLVSNYTTTRLQELFNKVSDYRFAEIRYLEGESVVGDEFVEFTPDEDSIKEVVVQLFYRLKD